MSGLKKFIYDWVFPVAAAIVIALLINKFLFYKIHVPSPSMYPAIKPGDRIIVTRTYNLSKLKTGDIVVFYSEERGETLIKRLIGLPGQQVDIDEKGYVYINGVKLEEPYVQNRDNKTASFKVPENHYLFLGDNRADSLDARYWKNPYIDQSEIKGKARFIIYPFNRLGGLK